MSISTSSSKGDWPRAALLCIALLLLTGLLTLWNPWVKARLTWRAYIMEDSGETIRFDPERGYRLTQNSARQTQYTWGVREYVGAWRGNNQGFQDARDFYPQRGKPSTYRLVVLGDSMTAAPFLERNWPDAIEDFAREDGYNLEVLNMAQDGTGLSNWWSLIKHEIIARGYDIDAVAMAVSGDALRRAFSIMSQHDEQLWFGEVPNPETRAWRPEEWPKTLDEARPYMRPIGVVCDSTAFEEVLQGDYGKYIPSPLTGVPSTTKAILLPIFDRIFGDTTAYVAGQQRMITDIGDWIRQKKVRALVVQVPLMGWINRGGFDDVSPEFRDFAHQIGAETINGNRAFQGLSENKIRDEYWLKYDGHWAQSGSDRFARFIYEEFKSRFPLSKKADSSGTPEDETTPSPGNS